MSTANYPETDGHTERGQSSITSNLTWRNCCQYVNLLTMIRSDLFRIFNLRDSLIKHGHVPVTVDRLLSGPPTETSKTSANWREWLEKQQ